MVWTISKRILSLFFLFGLLFGSFQIGCSENKQEGPKVCIYEHQCKENERCVYDDPSCVARTGQCKGQCIPQEPIPEKKCECKTDEDCNEPVESCASCQCIKRDVIPCKTNKDCVRGWYCLGEASGKGVCKQRENCKKDEDCAFGLVCREESCCNPKTNLCAGSCKEGTSCTSDADCYYCNMVCQNNKCALKSVDACKAKKCTKDEDCASCKGSCKAGFCVQ